jgi:peptidyl-prolyl cis-trans isomerase SurA
VNNQIIDLQEYQRAQQQLQQEAQRTNINQARLEQNQKDLLRDLIDQRLLLARGKELNINPDAELQREMDAIRKTNHMATMEDFEKALRQSGTSLEDFKTNLRNTIITRTVVQDDVDPNLHIAPDQVQGYYNQHKQDFAQPEQVRLSEILIPTPEDPTDAQIAQQQARVEEVLMKLKAGASFDDLAKQYSSGPNAATGGDLGPFKGGDLPKPLDQTASLNTGEHTGAIRTRQGFVVLKVTEHQAAGTPPFSTLEGQVKSAMYQKAIQPAARTYLASLRAKAHIEIAPGYVDTGSAASR